MAQTPSSAEPAENAQVDSGAVGPLLRQARQDQGKEIAAIAETLRIRREHLAAIEDSRYDALPGPTYAVGFVRAYAEFLGLDGAEVVRRFKAEGQSLPGRNDLSFPSPVREGGIPSGALIIIALLLAGVVYGGWQLSTSSQGGVAEMIENLPDRFMAMIGSDDKGDATAESPAETTGTTPAAEGGAPVATPPTEAPAAAPQGGESPLSAMPSAPAEAKPQAAPEPVEADQTPPAASAPEANTPEARAPEAAPAAASAPAKPAAADTKPAPEAESQPVARAEPVAETADETAPPEETPDDVAAPVEEPVAPGPFKVNDNAPAAPNAAAPSSAGQVVIVARADAWIEVTRNGSPVEKRMLHYGDRYTVPEGDGMMLRTGNAGGTQILFNGKAITSLGKNGDVAKGISLDPQDLERRLAQ